MVASLTNPGKRRSLGALWRRSPTSLRIGSIILLLQFAIAATGPFWAPYGPAQIQTGPPLSGMTWQHPFGVDQLGRDVFSRAVYGGHIVILLSLSGTFLGLVIGAVVGLFSGFLGFGLRPPTPEWGLMMSENRSLIIFSPMTVLGPGLMLASLVVGLNLFTEGFARILGRTVRLGDK